MPPSVASLLCPQAPIQPSASSCSTSGFCHFSVRNFSHLPFPSHPLLLWPCLYLFFYPIHSLRQTATSTTISNTVIYNIMRPVFLKTNWKSHYDQNTSDTLWTRHINKLQTDYNPSFAAQWLPWISKSVCIASLDSAAPLESLCINPQLNFFPCGMLQPPHSLSTPKVLLSLQLSEQSHLGISQKSLSSPCFSASPQCLVPYQSGFGL